MYDTIPSDTLPFHSTHHMYLLICALRNYIGMTSPQPRIWQDRTSSIERPNQGRVGSDPDLNANTKYEIRDGVDMDLGLEKDADADADTHARCIHV